jgi:hypothetical protein
MVLANEFRWSLAPQLINVDRDRVLVGSEHTIFCCDRERLSSSRKLLASSRESAYPFGEAAKLQSLVPSDRGDGRVAREPEERLHIQTSRRVIGQRLVSS